MQDVAQDVHRTLMRTRAQRGYLLLDFISQDAFCELNAMGNGIGVLVAEKPRRTAASFMLRSAVNAFCRALHIAAHRQGFSLPTSTHWQRCRRTYTFKCWRQAVLVRVFGCLLLAWNKPLRLDVNLDWIRSNTDEVAAFLERCASLPTIGNVIQ
jgi:hypothetical protein